MSGIFSFGRGDDPAMHGEFMGFVLDDESLLSLRGWAERQGFPPATAQQSGPNLFAQMLQSASPPKMAIIDIDGQSDPAALVTRLVSLCGGECRLVVVGSANDVSLYRRVLSAGAVDYLVKPLTSETLNQALTAALRNTGAPKQNKKESRIVAFIGARGGVGASTIALNVGWLMAHQLNLSVALLDLDLQFGTSSLALDLEPGRGLRDIVGSPQRVDGLMIASSITSESDNFSVLGAEETVDEVVSIDGGAITALLKEMKSNFETVIVDLPRHLIPTQKRLLTSAQEIVIVSDLTLAGIRDTLRIKNAIAALGCEARVTIVASRTDASGKGHIDSAIFEKGIQGKIDAVIADDANAFAIAANSGKALAAAAPRSALIKPLRDLAIRVAKIEESSAAPKSFWSKLGFKTKPKEGTQQAK